MRVTRRAYDALRAAAPAFGALPVAAALLLASGCGAARQDAHEPSGSFAMEVLKVSFPSKQAVSRPASFELQVHNSGGHTVPNVAVTLDSFYYTEHFPELAADKRPIWVIERGPGAVPNPPVQSEEVSKPGNGQTAYVNTWALGPLASGSTQTFVWKVIPVKGGPHTVTYTVAGGLSGKAKAVLSSGTPVQGQLTAQVASAPPITHVNPSTGRVVLGLYPLTP